MSATLATRSAEQVLAGLLAISVQGDAMPTSPDTMYARMLTPLAGEFALIEALAARFATEINPATALLLLTNYQAVLGPDPYGRDVSALSIGEQQQIAYTRWVGKFGVRPADFIAMAASLGVVISIQQYSLTVAGDFAGVTLVGNPTQFAWLVTLPTPAVTDAEAGSASAGDLCSSFPPNLVQPAIAGRAPAQTNPYFSYTG